MVFFLIYYQNPGVTEREISFFRKIYGKDPNSKRIEITLFYYCNSF